MKIRLLQKVFFVVTLLLLLTIKLYGQAIGDSSARSTSAAQRHLEQDLFYDSLRTKLEKRKFTKELSRMIFVQKRHAPKLGSAVKSDAVYQQFSGHPIRRIKYIRLRPFGTSVTQIDLRPDNWIHKTGNHMALLTRPWILRNNMLVQEGSRLDPYVLAESERHLRQLPFIKDARIYAVPFQLGNDSVDLIVVTRDIFPFGADIQMKDINKFDLNVYNANILGTGQRVRHRFMLSGGAPDLLGYQGKLQLQNMLGTFITTEAEYYHNTYYRSVGAVMNREFYVPVINYAGRASLLSQTNKSLYYDDDLTNDADIVYLEQDYSLGRAFRLINDNSNKFTSLNVSLRYWCINHSDRPTDAKRKPYEYVDKQLFLANMSLFRQNFYKSSMIYGFGRTEDIPFGYLIDLTGGYEINEQYDRGYIGLRSYGGKLFDNESYAFVNINVGTYYTKDGIEEGTFEFEGRLFSPLFTVGSFALRQFLSVRHTVGFKKLFGDTIILNERNGLNGYRQNDVYGTRRFSANMESVFFAPWKFYNFKFTFFLYGDVCFIGKKQVVVRNRYFWGSGVGIRIKNETLAMPTIQFRLGYLGNLANANSSVHFMVSEQQRLRMDNFNGRRPEVILFE